MDPGLCASSSHLTSSGQSPKCWAERSMVAHVRGEQPTVWWWVSFLPCTVLQGFDPFHFAELVSTAGLLGRF